MVTNRNNRVWINPPKFWAATKQMSREDAEKLVEKLMSLSELGDFETLRKFDFVVIGGPTLNPKHSLNLAS
jgi:hypothetical protein